MPAYARQQIVAAGEPGAYRCMAMCVRSAYLCGVDRATRKNYDHRLAWIRDRLEELSRIFAVEVLGFAVLPDRLHVVLQTRPDLAAMWSDEKVLEQWGKFTLKQLSGGLAGSTEPEEVDRKTIKERRRRLSDVSWFMRSLCEPIARRANREDDVQGRFWSGRFKSQALLDEPGLLTCLAYVDLLPLELKAGKTLAKVPNSSASDRLQAGKNGQARSRKGASSRARTKARQAGWLAGFGGAASLAPASRGIRRTALTLPLDAGEYAALLDWTGRQIKTARAAAVPDELGQILDRFGIRNSWLESVKNFESWFKRAVGRKATLDKAAQRAGKQWFQGFRHSEQAFPAGENR